MACQEQPDQEVWRGAGSCRLSPVLAQIHLEACQMGVSWQLSLFRQVMTFWTLVSLYVKSGEHLPSLFVEGQSSQAEYFY